MAAKTSSISIEQDQFSCPVCLEVLRDPVTIPCGHSYCLDCIEDYWSRNKHKGFYSCPQCRQMFNPKPAVSKNTVLADVVEKIQGTGVRRKDQEQHFTKPDVKCGVCAGKRDTAVKSCLTCVESYCEGHLRVHEARFQGKAHKLLPALTNLREKMCYRHDKLLRSYCRTDHQCVCAQCVKEIHKDHDTVSAANERKTQQKSLEAACLKSFHKLKVDEKELKYIVRYIKHVTEAALDESEKIFSKIASSIERQRLEVRELIRAEENTALSQAEQLLQNTEKEIAELRKKDAELEKLSCMEDHVYFLQRSKTFQFPSKAVELPSTDALSYLMYKSMRGALSYLKDTLERVCERELSRVSDKVMSLKENSHGIPANTLKVKESYVPSSSEPRTRDYFLQYYNDLALDWNTANVFLSHFDGLRGVITESEPQPYTDHPERFTSWAQILCREGLAGCCYWEVEWSGTRGVSIGVCYKGMSRNTGGSDSKLGHNSRSWSLDCSSSACSFQHNEASVAVCVPRSNRIGVYLDFRGGSLSFYGVSDTMLLLHKAKATFTQPLYAGFWVGLGSMLKLC